MAAISSISASPDAQAVSGRQVADRASRADTSRQPESPQAGMSQPKGVRRVLKEQRDKELQASPPAEAELRHLAESLQETINKAARQPYRVGIRNEEATGNPIIEIRDKEGNIVKQFPPEKVLNLQRKMDELSGMVIDEMI